ncbi:SCO2322 family protein [Streptomyces sp. HPF1205]|uniref:SCO2322 family protein n=1 Tax=Streptomyces sp. HPF1205 TaxID=2873262 RepID=UPI001CEDB2AD|nr:SCO2322 family protein [Streptomyces sp. HPF1205]
MAALVLVTLAAAPARATGYRYWSYWLLGADGAWTYAQTGPAFHTPHDGDVEGWRFAVSRDAADKATRPRETPAFATVCAHTPPAPGRKRVALVIDAGTDADAPAGETPARGPRTACARVPEDASSADALAAVAKPLRYDSSGILCAIDGYPAAGCGEQVSAKGGSDGGSNGDAAGGSGGGSGKGPNGGSGKGSGDGAGAGAPSAGRASGHHGDGPALGLYAGGGAVLLLGGAAVWQARRRRS